MTREECVTVNVSPRASDIVAQSDNKRRDFKIPRRIPVDQPKAGRGRDGHGDAHDARQQRGAAAACMAKAPPRLKTPPQSQRTDQSRLSA